MNASRLLALVGVIIIAIFAVQADAALTAADPLTGALFLFEPSLPVLLGLALLIPFAVAPGASQAPPRRRRVNRARLRARRAAA
jgi:hypothetical protein